MLRCHRQRNQGDRARSGRAPGPAVPGEVLPESSLPSQRIPTQQDEGRGADQCQDEDPETSNHNLREQDEEGNFMHLSDDDQGRGKQVDEDLQPNPHYQQGHSRRKEGCLSRLSSPQQEGRELSPARPSFFAKAWWESVTKAWQRKMSRMAPDIHRVLHKELDYLTGLALTDRVDNHLEKAMRNYEELCQVEKDHGEMMDEFIKSAEEARALLDQGTDDSPKTRATTISQVKGKITSFQRYRVVLQNKAALIKKLRWRSVTCKAERDVVRLIDLLSADCERLEKEAADEAAIGAANAAALNTSVPPVIPATERERGEE